MQAQVDPLTCFKDYQKDVQTALDAGDWQKAATTLKEMKETCNTTDLTIVTSDQEKIASLERYDNSMQYIRDALYAGDWLAAQTQLKTLQRLSSRRQRDAYQNCLAGIENWRTFEDAMNQVEAKLLNCQDWAGAEQALDAIQPQKPKQRQLIDAARGKLAPCKEYKTKLKRVDDLLAASNWRSAQQALNEIVNLPPITKTDYQTRINEQKSVFHTVLQKAEGLVKNNKFEDAARLLDEIASADSPFSDYAPVMEIRGKMETERANRHKQDSIYRLSVENTYKEALEDGTIYALRQFQKTHPNRAAEVEAKILELQQAAISVPKLVPVEAGKFELNCPENPDANASPFDYTYKTTQKTNRSFILGKFEVKNSEFCGFLNEEGHLDTVNAQPYIVLAENGVEYGHIKRIRNKYVVDAGFERHPVVYVTWYGANAYCNWLSRRTGKKYRLPTELEWVYVATERGHIFDETNKYQALKLNHKGNTQEDVQGLAVGGRFVAEDKTKNNLFGVDDIFGNAAEWCKDSVKSGRNSEGTEQTTYVIKGGSWKDTRNICLFFNTRLARPTHASEDIGFRVLCER